MYRDVNFFDSTHPMALQWNAKATRFLAADEAAKNMPTATRQQRREKDAAHCAAVEIWNESPGYFEVERAVFGFSSALNSAPDPRKMARVAKEIADEEASTFGDDDGGESL